MDAENATTDAGTARLGETGVGRTSMERRDLLRRLDAVYVRRPEDAILAELLDAMVDRTETGKEGRAVIVAGASGAGKTTLIEEVTRDHPELSIADPLAGTSGMLVVQVPASTTVADLGSEIARATGYPVKDGLKASTAWLIAMRRLQLVEIRYLWLDEVGNLADNLNAKEARKVRTHLKMALANRRHRVGLVLSGVTPALGFLLEDGQVQRRSAVVEIAPVDGRMHGMIARAAAKLAAKADLALPVDFRRTVVPRLAHAALDAFGTTVELTKETILRVAGRGGSKPRTLTLEDYATTWARRHGVAAHENPFVVPAWQDLDCSAIVARKVPAPTPEPVRKRGGKVTGGVV